MMRTLFYLFCCASVLIGAIDPDLPSPAPTVRAAFPPGASRGASVVVELSGQNLYDTRTVEFAGRGVRAEILSALGTKVKMKVTVDPTAEVGRRDYRLTTMRGAYVGSFDIGSIREMGEIENNDDWRKPQPIALPVLVNGNIGNEDWDHFRFHANAGERLVFDVSATRYGSRLDADVAILDLEGRELAWVDDTTIYGDPHVEFQFDRDGDYIVRVGSLNGGGNYRLVAGALPYARRTLPAGLEAGKETVLTFNGTLLDRVDEVWIGDRLAKAQILSKTATELRARVQVPKETPAGRYVAHVSAGGLEVAVPTEMRISTLPEITVSKAPADRETAQAISPSVVLNGVISEPKQSHFFRFDAKAGDTFLFRAESMKLGYHLDPTITVFDAEGKKVAFADDPGIDDRADEYQLDPDLSLRCDKAGPYYVAIRDGMYRGGEQLVYRLTVRRQAPDFELEIRESLKSFYSGQKDTILVRVRRRAGWNTPVEIWAEGLPAGVMAERLTAEPKDSVVKDTCGVERVIDGSIALVPVIVNGAASGTFELKIKGRGVIDGRTVEHFANVHYNHNALGYIYGPAQMQQAEITISEPPGAIVTAPDTLTLAAKAVPLKLGIRRFGAAKQLALIVRPKVVPAGLRMAEVKAPVSAKEVTLSITGDVPVGGAVIRLEVVSEADGKVIGESAPILIEARKQ